LAGGEAQSAVADADEQIDRPGNGRTATVSSVKNRKGESDCPAWYAVDVNVFDSRSATRHDESSRASPRGRPGDTTGGALRDVA
jgi:hypothetical protein